MGNAKLVNATQLSAQSVRGAFAIVKAMQHENLGIIKKRRILPREKFCEKHENFHFQAHRENYKGANFHGLAYNFYGHIG